MAQTRGILITTFEKRQFSSALPLIQQIRGAGINYPILVFLNGNLDRNHDDHLRSLFLQEISKIKNVGILTSFEMTGISRNWNLGIQILGTELTACFSDDLVVSPNFREELDMVFDAASSAGFITIEGFAAFVISRLVIDEIGWFDERFLGFGEEDGDYVWRFIKRFGQEPPRFKSLALVHQNLQTRGEEIAGISKYSLFNLVWRKIKYEEVNEGISGCFTKPQSQRFSDFAYHPMENFRRRNKHLLQESEENIISEHILKYLSKESFEFKQTEL
jgi:GT2 family glycosyltransferase